MVDYINQEYLKALLDYNPETGKFRWIQSKFGRQLHKDIETLDARGYIVIKIDYDQYLGHRLAWLYMTGEWPKNLIDHKDGVTNNNKWENLREASNHQNVYNRKINKNNTTGLKGVFDNGHGKFIARIQHNGKKLNLGTYKTKEEAAEVYRLKALEIQGEFVRNE